MGPSARQLCTCTPELLLSQAPSSLRGTCRSGAEELAARYSSVMVLGDLHGDLLQAHAALKMLGAVDEVRCWVFPPRNFHPHKALWQQEIATAALPASGSFNISELQTGHWNAGRALLVQLGDLVDRGEWPVRGLPFSHQSITSQKA